jgi:dipeptidyl-peptidase-3
MRRAIAACAVLVGLGCSTIGRSGRPPAPPKATPPAAAITILGTVRGVTIASYPPTGFDTLKPEERVLAYHLAAAAMAGDPLLTMQASRHAWPITQAVSRLLALREKLPTADVDELLEYRRMLFLHHGIHDAFTGQKFLPLFDRKDFEAAIRRAGIRVSTGLLAAMFDPTVAPYRINKTPGEGKDPVVESAANHYEGVTSRDLQDFDEKYVLNGRIVKRDGKLIEEVYRAGGDGVPPGRGAAELGRIVRHLEEAIGLAPPAQQATLRLLVRYFRSGDNRAFENHDIAWLAQVFPVDYILGFVETYSDVRQRKGTFEGFVAIADPDRDPPLQALAKHALYFEQRMPWRNEWKRESIRVPAAAAVNVIAATGDAGPFGFGGVNLPNPQELRQTYGSKNFVVLSLLDTWTHLWWPRAIDEFVPEEARAEIHRCLPSLRYATVALHEVTGHGSGKVSPELAADPAEVLAPDFSTLEEGRAELVAHYLIGDPKTVEIGVLPDAGCARIYPQYATVAGSLMVRYVPEGDAAEEDHLRATLIELGYLRDAGAISTEVRGGKTFHVVKDPEAWRRASGELLAEHQRIKATGDRATLSTLVEKYGTRIDAEWRDEVIRRLHALSLPSDIAMLPPTLTAVRDERGRIVDARAEQTMSLDGYIETLERRTPNASLATAHARRHPSHALTSARPAP